MAMKAKTNDKAMPGLLLPKRFGVPAVSANTVSIEKR
jgi:hypothetical protein